MFVTVGKRLGVDISAVPVMDIKINNGYEFDKVVNDFDGYGKLEVTGLMAATIYGFNYIARTYLHYDANMNLLSVTL